MNEICFPAIWLFNRFKNIHADDVIRYLFTKRRINLIIILPPDVVQYFLRYYSMICIISRWGGMEKRTLLIIGLCALWAHCTFMLLFSWLTLARSCSSFCSSLLRLSASSRFSSSSLFISSNWRERRAAVGVNTAHRPGSGTCSGFNINPETTTMVTVPFSC